VRRRARHHAGAVTPAGELGGPSDGELAGPSDRGQDDTAGGELGAPLPGQRIRTRAMRPPVDPRLLRLDPSVPRYLAVTGGLALVTAAALIAQATALAAVVARSFLAGAVLADLRGWLVVLLAAVGVRAAATWATDLVAQRTSAGVKSRLRAAVIDRVTRRPPGEEADSAGALASALTDGIDALDGTFGGYLPALVAGLVVPVAIVGWLVAVDLTSALVLGVTLPLIPLFMVLIGLAARAATRRRFRALSDLSGHLLAVLQGLTTIRVARASDRVARRVRDAGERLRRTTLETLRVAFVSALALELLAALAVATIAVIAGVRLAEGTGAAFEPVLVALLLAPDAFLPLRRVGQQFHANEDGAAAAERLLDLLDAPTDSCGRTASAPGSALPGRTSPVGSSAPSGRTPAPDPASAPVRLERVTVTHSGRPLPALDRVDLTVRPGEQLAILGASGAGKTTLATVLLGLRAPDQGRVVVGTVDVADLDPDAWHARLAWVPQAPADLGGTVRELVTLGHPAPASVPDAAVLDALAAVGLDAEVAALPAGPDTRVGPAGRGLSTGQRRRVAIARALVRPAGMLVLDEPTGDLDVHSERAVRTALAGLRGRRSVVVLTHRVALASRADRVVVLDAGRLAEVGTPTELARRDGPYAALVAASRPLTESDLPACTRPASASAESPSTHPPSASAKSPSTHPPSASAESPSTRPAGASAESPPPIQDPLANVADAATTADAAGHPRPLRQAVDTLRGLLHPHRRQLALAVTAGTITPLAGIVLVALSTYLIARAALRPNLLDLTVVIVGVRALSLLKATSRYTERLAGHDVALRSGVDLRTHAYLWLVPQAPAGLARHRVGEVLDRVVADVDRLQLALVRGVVPLIGGLLAATATAILAALLLPAAGTVLAFGLALAAVGVPFVASRLARRPERELAAARGRLTAELVDVLQAAPELRLLGRLGPARHHLAGVDAEVVRLDRSTVARGGGADALVQLVLGLSAVGIVLVAVPAVAAGTLDGVVLGALVVLALAAIEAVGPLPSSARALVAAGAAAQRLREVLDVPPPAPDPVAALAEPVAALASVPLRVAADPVAPVSVPAVASAPPECPLLVVDGVSARYPGAPQPAVRDLALEVRPGRSVAVVGRSGAGKSTLANLTVRFLDPEVGEIRLDAVPLTALTGDEVRGVVALAPQDAHVFEGTLASNLRLAAPDAEDEVLWEALAAAQLEGWVRELPDGLATTVGERGSRLSGGQRHRLALARTLLMGAPLVVFDEPTADLDPVTGRGFLRDALRAASGRGVVVLAHDLRVLPVVDDVVVLEAGRIVARGSHRRLLTTDAAYAARWELDTTVPDPRR
jgi:ATP-binding cassette, subfamily C, bacterial CydCD